MHEVSRNYSGGAVFLAGGITGCPDWQKEMVELLRRTNLAVLNSRRASFPLDDPKAGEVQIRWEFEQLRKADLISFWFCKGYSYPNRVGSACRACGRHLSRFDQ